MSEPALRILLIDHDQAERLACRRALASDPRYRFVLLEADTARKGLHVARRERPDCILLDYRLPDADGFEVLAGLALGRGEPESPVVMLTSVNEVAVAVEAMRRGARDYLVKDSERCYLALLPSVLARVVEEERLRAEKREAESRLRTIADAVPGLLAYVDCEERYRFTNARYQEWFGTSAQALYGKSLREVLGQEAYARARPYIEGAIAGRPQAFEDVIEVGGQPHHLYVRFQPHRDECGCTLGFSVSAFDVTELKRTEQELRAERDFIAAVLRTAGALVIVLDRESRVVRFNEACEAASGYRFEELRGKVFWDLQLVPAEEAEAVRRVFDDLRTGLFPNRYENHWRHRDGSKRLIAWANTALSGADGQVEYVIATGIDVTEQRAAEERARRGQAEVERLFRQYALAAMASVFAHELNQPLAAIATYSEASLRLLRAGRTDGQLAHNLEQIALQAQRAAHMIRHVRNLLRRGELETSSEDLNALVGRILGQVAPEAQALGVRLQLDPGEVSRVRIERLAVEKVLLNLLHNALEAMRDAHTANGVLTVRTRPAEGFVQVTVEDTGPGLDPESAARIFQPFYTTKPEGLGMGLAISRTLIEAHGGRLWAEPRDRGAAFHFTLPIAT